MDAHVSIIMPAYNAEIFIGDAIQSVLNQTYPYWELLVIDDGSKDRTGEVVKSFSDERIKYHQIGNSGQAAASNYGLSLAQGEYIKFIDADDLINPEHIYAQLQRLDGGTHALASCAWGRFYDGNPASAQFIPETVWKDLPSLEWIKQSLTQKYDMMGAWVWLIPHSVLRQTGGWDERLTLNNDFEFSMRLLTHVTEVRFASEAKLYYRSGIPSLSQTTSVNAYEAAVLSTELGCSYLLAKENSEMTRRLCADRYQEWLFRIYPSDDHLVKRLEGVIADLGGSVREMDGGRVFRFLCRLVGWKRAKLLKAYLNSNGYRKLPFN